MTPSLRRLLPALAALLVAAPAAAQRVLGPGDDATTPGAGRVLFSIGGQWDVFDHVMGRNGGPALNIGSGLLTDTMSGNWTPLMRPVTSFVRGMAGDNTLPVTLGALRGSIEARNWRVPVRMEVGVTRWLSVAAEFSLVRHFTSAYLQVNPIGTFANTGLNPTLYSPTAAQTNQQALQQLQAATSQLTAAYPCVTSAPTSPGCAAPAATAALLQKLLSGVQGVYLGTPVAPMAGSRLDTLIRGRFATANASLRTLLALGSDPITALPVGAASRLGLSDFNALLGLPAIGYGPDTLGQRGRVTAGDYVLSAKLRFLDTFGSDRGARLAADGVRVRSALVVTGTIGSGHSAVSSVWTDQGTSTKATSLELRSLTDVQLTRWFWGTLSLRKGQWGSERQLLRLTGADGTPALLGADYDAWYTRRRGGWTQLELTPRVVFNDYFAAGATYGWTQRDADTFTLQTTGPGPDPSPYGFTGARPAGLDGILSLGGSEQRVGVGLTYSSVAARQRGKGGFPLDVTYQHQEVIAGDGLPRRSIDLLSLKLYW